MMNEQGKRYELHWKRAVKRFRAEK